MHKGLVLANPTLVCPLAFCFYNLSSIINGLVYFNEFSALSTTKLLLVSLGIVVLLAGVWIVSFPPSGGIRVGVGKWDGSEELPGVVFDEEGGREGFEDEPLPMISQPHTDTEEVFGLGLVHSTDDVERQKIYASLRVQTHTQPFPTPHVRSLTESALPSHSSHLPTHPEHAPIPTHLTSPPNSPSKRPRAISAISPSGSHQTNRQSLSGYAYPAPSRAAPGTLTGFSIGLSPVSPGFALVPRDRSRRRRRATAGPGSIEGGSIISDSTRFSGGHPMKRSVSVGDVSSIGTERHVEGDDEAGETDRLLGDEEERGRQGGGPRDAGTSQHAPGKSKTRQSRSRWKWFKSVLSLKRG